MNTEEIPNYILRDVAEAIMDFDGDWYENEKIVNRINSMTKDEIFKKWCEWQGLIDWSSEIKGVVMHIFGFEEKDD